MDVHLLEQNGKIGRWNVDLEDCDNILRAETRQDIAGEIIAGMERLGFWCKELE